MNQVPKEMGDFQISEIFVILNHPSVASANIANVLVNPPF